MTSNVMPAGWFADPTGRHEYRYWDSLQWTENVADHGVLATDPPTLSVTPAPPATPSPAAPAPAPAAVVPPAAATEPVVVPGPAQPAAPGPPASAAPVLGAREIVVPDGRRFYVGMVLAGLGLAFYAVLATIGFLISLGAGENAPLIYLGSRDVGFGTEYYVPGLLFVILAFGTLALQPRMDSTLKNRQSREFLTQQLGLTSSWKYTTAFVAKSFRWRRIASVIGAGLLFLAAVVTSLAISSDGFTLSIAAFLLMLLGGVALSGAGIMLTTPSRRLRVDTGGRILEALE